MFDYLLGLYLRFQLWRTMRRLVRKFGVEIAMVKVGERLLILGYKRTHLPDGSVRYSKQGSTLTISGDRAQWQD